MTLCKELSSLISGFWCGSSPTGRKIHWVKWLDLCLPKTMGGLGFRDLGSFNKALLAKQGWRILTEPTALLARVMKAKYFPHCSFLNARLGYNPSYSWRNIHGIIDILKAGLKWRVGNGKEISIWKDKWLPTPSTYRVMTAINTLSEEAVVSSLIDDDSKRWRSTLIDQIFWPHEADAIKSIPLSSHDFPDRYVWAPNKNGLFSARTAYHMVFQMKVMKDYEGECSSGSDVRVRWWQALWGMACPNKSLCLEVL